LLGRKVSTIVSEFKNAGKYKVNFNSNGLSTGVYYYQMISGSSINTKSMVVIK
jgi:hypothetical protein